MEHPQKTLYAASANIYEANVYVFRIENGHHSSVGSLVIISEDFYGLAFIYRFYLCRGQDVPCNINEIHISYLASSLNGNNYLSSLFAQATLLYTIMT